MESWRKFLVSETYNASSIQTLDFVTAVRLRIAMYMRVVRQSRCITV